MFQSYLKLAWRVLWRRKFFTAISLFGICFTLVVLMVATAVLDHIFAPLAPEVRQDRTLGVIPRADDRRHRLAVEHARLPAARPLRPQPSRASSGWRSSAMPQTVYSYPSGQRIKSLLKRTDAEYWRVLDFTFLEGGPFTDQDVPNGVARGGHQRRPRATGSSAARPPSAARSRPTASASASIGVVPDVPILRLVGERRHLRARSRRPRPTPTARS